MLINSIYNDEASHDGVFPSKHGFKCEQATLVAISGGTTIAGVMQYLNSAKVWTDIDATNSVISGDYLQKINGGKDFFIRLKVTAYAGDWAYSFHENRS